MKVFVSHSTNDDEAVRQLVADIISAGHQVWVDSDLGGGELWWSRICREIRECRVFVSAVSDSSLRSLACIAELTYAVDLGLPILPVEIGPVRSRTDPVFRHQAVVYLERSHANGIKLSRALFERAENWKPLPDQLPDEPELPFEYLGRWGRAMRGGKQLSPGDQADMVRDLRKGIEDDYDVAADDDARDLLRTLRASEYVTHRIAMEIDGILGVGAETRSVEGFWAKLLYAVDGECEARTFLIEIKPDGVLNERHFLGDADGAWDGEWERELTEDGRDKLIITFGRWVGTVVRVNDGYFIGTETEPVWRDDVETDERHITSTMALVRIPSEGIRSKGR